MDGVSSRYCGGRAHVNSGGGFLASVLKPSQ